MKKEIYPQKEYYHVHREERKAYYLKNRQEKLTYSKNYYQKNREAQLKRVGSYKKQNGNKIKEYAAEYRIKNKRLIRQKYQIGYAPRRYSMYKHDAKKRGISFSLSIYEILG